MKQRTANNYFRKEPELTHNSQPTKRLLTNLVSIGQKFFKKGRNPNPLTVSNDIYFSNSAEETHAFAKRLALTLPKRSTIAFSGDLGAGKTTFIRGLVEAIAQVDPREVSSPTFNFLHIYEGIEKIYHFDLYRLPNEQEFLSCGFDDFIHLDGICCIEWAERIPSILPKSCLKIHIKHAGEHLREIHIERGGAP